jgi:hypothetical protein
MKRNIPILLYLAAVFPLSVALGQEDPTVGSPPGLRRLTHVQHPSQRPDRDIRSRWPYLPDYQGNAEADPNPQYLVQPTDVVELFFHPTVLTTPKLNLSIRFPGDPVEGIALIRDVRRPKFPLGLLKLRRGANRIERILFRVQPDATAELDPTSISIPGATWQQVKSAFEGVTIDGAPLKARLIPAAAEYAAPGDSVRLYRMHMNREGVQRTEDFQLQVDPDGFVWIPPQTSGLIAPGTALAIQDPFVRGVNGVVDAAYFRIRVAYPNRAAADQPMLSEIARRLSSLGKEFDQATLDDWLTGEVDEQFLAGDADASGLRYHLTAVGERTWDLVDEAGRRHTHRHRGRELLIEAVNEGYRTLTGHELLAGATGLRAAAFLTVIPRGTSHVRPFYGRVDSGDPHCQLRGLSLEPGDTVIVSRNTPRELTASLP